MKIDQELALSSPGEDSLLTIGVFDGVHRGHRDLLSHLMVESTRMGLVAGVVTFRNHPASVLRPDFKPQYLTSLEDRIDMIGRVGVNFVVPVTFDLELSKLSAGEFIDRLQERLRMRGLVVGPDFAMGHKREGDVNRLALLAEQMGFSLSLVDLVTDDGQPIKSTTIRKALARGDVSTVAMLLGRNFALAGVVVKGVGRGKGLGFPTANLEVPAGLAIPGDGIYATWAHLSKRRYMAATSIGTRPTFNETERTIEAFILDFDGEVYGKEVRLEFVRRLRDELKYDTVRGLQEQVDRDVDQTRAILRAG